MRIIRHKYIIDTDKLERGDIVLTAETSKQSKGVRLATFGHYSHAAIWVGGTMIEATLQGVFSKNPQRLLVDNPDHLAIYRSKTPLSHEVQDKVCEYAQSKIGSLYAISEAALMLPMRLLSIKESKGQFCSRLAACSYQYAGYDLKNLRDPNFCSPRQLSLCKAFQRVEGVVREASQAEIAFAQTPDPVIKNFAATYEWLNKVRDLVNDDPVLSRSYDIQAQNDVTELLLEHPELDATITGFMRNTEYLTFFDYDRRVNPYRYSRISMLNKIKEFPFNADSFLQKELGKEPRQFMRFENNIVGIIHNIKLHRLDFFLENLKLYRNLMNECLVRMEILAFGFDLIGSTKTVESMKALMGLAKQYIKQADEILGQ